MNVANPAALKAVLAVMAEGSREQRLALSRFSPDTRSFYADMLESTARTIGQGVEDIRAQAVVGALLRFVWSLVPARLFTAMTPDFRRMAAEALRARIGEAAIDADLVRRLSVIFKRMRTYVLEGRNAATLDLEMVRHAQLLERQGARCNHCLYEFAEDFYRFAAEDDGVVAVPYLAHQDEVVLDKVFRRPELDHVIPLILGGDSEENWQILCATCNRGKSDQLSYFFSLGGASTRRWSDLYGISAGKRYAVISEYRSTVSPSCVKGDGAFCRLYKKDPAGYLNVDNLKAVYE